VLSGDERYVLYEPQLAMPAGYGHIRYTADAFALTRSTDGAFVGRLRQRAG
jgi:hypothetical protein